MWRIAYDWHSRLPERLKTEHITSLVKIHWGEANTAEIQANSFSDALFGLGYVQGQLNGWTIALWRQAALGKLHEWYGSEVFEADRLVRKLELSEIAQASYSRLNPDETRLIASFGEGIRLALEETDRMHEFVLQDIVPDPWEPWHTFAIERLIAWMSSTSEPVCNLGTSICSGMENLRSILLLDGFESSSTWVISTARSPLLYQRHILGKSRSPAFQEVVLRVSDELELHGASLLGTPFFPTGKTNEQAWSILLHSPKTSRPTHSTSMRTVRLRFPDREELVHYKRSDSTFNVPESKTELFWDGFGTETDTRAWFALLHNRSLPFQIWRGDGLLIRPDTPHVILGDPEFVSVTNHSGLVISNDSLIYYDVHYLDRLNPDFDDPLSWITDTYSPWIAETLPPKLDSLRIPMNSTAMIRSALAYLRNWDYDFGEKSIGATIYHEWMIADGEAPEDAFYNAVDELAQKYGPNPSEWLWARVHIDTSWVTFGGASDHEIFQPFISPIVGHESTMIWGGFRATAAPSIWEMWTWIEPGGSHSIRRWSIDFRQPLGRYISGKRGSTVFSLPTPYFKTTLMVTK
ncbi:MAG: penicillin acylase family protein [Bacteroidetes bacterium]|nr:penicillin acylase family protein [Bacteroidota bacterium]MCY4206062.1 penicillin acylase family protein [Bacteroidota bacterium]